MSAAPPPHVPPPTDRSQITIVSHSTLFYWWPVWAIGFVMWAASYFSGYVMAVVPAHTKGAREVTVADKKHDVLVLPENKHLPSKDKDDPKGEADSPYLHVAAGKSYGVLFATVLLMVIVITNVPLRGMWSLVIIMVIGFMVIILWLANLWETILYHVNLLDIRINAGGYLFISTVLFVAWLATMLFFDHQIYIVFTPGNFKVCTEIGGGERVFDTVGMTLERQRSDLFRHWILGLGSGDLVVKTTGAQAQHFDLPNVLFIGKKVQQIEQLLKTKQVVETR